MPIELENVTGFWFCWHFPRLEVERGRQEAAYGRLYPNMWLSQSRKRETRGELKPTLGI